MRHRPFFLLEVLIATILVGGFAFLAIQGSFRTIAKHRKMLLEIENSRKEDLKRMELLEKYWNQAPFLIHKEGIQEAGYTITCKEGKKGKYYLLELKKEGNCSYCYFILRETR